MDNPEPTNKRKDPSDLIASWLMGLGLTVIATGMAVGFFKGVLGIGEERLEVVASARQADTNWFLTGRIMLDGEPAEGSTVWAVVTDERGNRFSPPAVTNAPQGEFQITGIPAVLSGTNKPRSLEATLHAKAPRPPDPKQKQPPAWIRGSETLILGDSGGTRWVKLPLWAVVPLLCIFVGSIFVSLIRFGPDGMGVRIKYYSSVALALLLTVMMIAYLTMALRSVSLTGIKGEVFALGFANIFHGSYVTEAQPEWLLSLTAPEPIAPSSATGPPDAAHGFGAPLWVLFMAVLGGGIFTLLILMRGITEPVNFANDADVCKRVEEIVRHQFYILFSPVGAIFVYQLMVSAGMSSQPVTVALVALAAGISLNLLLNRALELLRGLFK